MTTKQALLNLSLILTLFFSFTSCESDPDSEPTVTTPELSGDSAVLSAATQSSAMLPSEKGENGHSRIYHIQSASDFKLFVEKVNNGDFEAFGESSGEKAEFILDLDLQVSDDYEWIPIGNDSHPFTCTFDGNGHTVSGSLSMMHNQALSKSTGSDNFRFGFFGNFYGSLRNLTLDFDLNASPAQQFNSLSIGMLGHLSGGDMTNVHTMGKIEYRTASESQDIHIGGFSSYMSFCQINKCSSDVDIDINGGPDVSGNLLRTENLYVGGLTAVICGSNITDFENNGDINITNCEVNNRLYTGGLASTNEYLRNPLLLVFNNNGNINVSSISTRNHDSMVNVAVGGLIGFGEINSQSGKVTNCGNLSIHIDSRELFTYVGGLFGFTLDECVGLSNS